MRLPALNALRPFVTRNHQNRLLLAAALCLLIGAGQLALAASAQDPDIEHLNQLVAASRYEEAFNYSKQLMKEHE